MTRCPAIGIDLGTTYCCVGIFRNGKVDIIENEHGKRKTASYVAFKGWDRLIGDSAFDKVTINPTNTVFDSKRLIGRKFEDELVVKDMKYWPFDVVNVNDKPEIQVEFMGETKLFIPEQISSMMLMKMKETAESYLRRKVTNAVVTVPAHFTDAQRQATKDAAEIAGLNVRLINEPTAAAITYAVKSHFQEENVLIFDFGGGTLGVSIVNITNKKVVVKSTGGDTHLGGEDIDNRLVDHFVDQIKSQYNIDITENKKAIMKLRKSVEKAKQILSCCSMASVEVEGLFRGHDFSSSITRDSFDEICNDIFQSALTHVKRTLEDAKMVKTDIDQVILVGGSSRIPRIQKMLRDFFSGKELNKTINLDEAVACGAAIYAAILNGEKDPAIEGLIFKDITSFSLGIKTQGYPSSCIIPRHCIFPTSGGESFDFPLMHSHGQLGVFENIDNIGRICLTRLTSKSKKIAQITISFSVDVNGILCISLRDESSQIGKRFSMTDQRDRLSKIQMIELIEEAKKLKLEDNKRKEQVNALCRLIEYCYEIEKKMMDPNNAGMFDLIDQQIVMDACDEVTGWIDQNKMAQTEMIEEKEKNLKIICENILEAQATFYYN